MSYAVGVYIFIGLAYYIYSYKEILEAAKDREVLPIILFSVWFISCWPMFMYSVHKGVERERSKLKGVEDDS